MRYDLLFSRKLPRKMIVLCVEGCHGSGKSSLCDRICSQSGFELLDEGFLDMPSTSLHPQTLMMESIWASRWFERILIKQRMCGDDKVIVADRSPFSAVYYSGNGHLLDPIIQGCIDELKEKANIHIYTICIRVDESLLWNRIKQRLEHEPERARYNEDSIEWMRKTNRWYLSRTWDFIVDNNASLISKSVAQMFAEIGTQIGGLNPELYSPLLVTS